MYCSIIFGRKSVFDDEVKSGLILIANDDHVRAWLDAKFANGKVEIGKVKCAGSGKDGNIFHFCLFQRSLKYCLKFLIILYLNLSVYKN